MSSRSLNIMTPVIIAILVGVSMRNQAASTGESISRLLETRHRVLSSRCDWSGRRNIEWIYGQLNRLPNHAPGPSPPFPLRGAGANKPISRLNCS